SAAPRCARPAVAMSAKAAAPPAGAVRSSGISPDPACGTHSPVLMRGPGSTGTRRSPGGPQQCLARRGTRLNRRVRVGGLREFELLANDRMNTAGSRLSESRLGHSPELFRAQRLTPQHGDLVLSSEFRADGCEAPACHAERAEAATPAEQGERGQADVP